VPDLSGLRGAAARGRSIIEIRDIGRKAVIVLFGAYTIQTIVAIARLDAAASRSCHLGRKVAVAIVVIAGAHLAGAAITCGNHADFGINRPDQFF
jgi:hypothetical protein